MKTTFLKKAGLALAMGTAIQTAPVMAASAPAEQPNILMIFVDDMHYGALGVTGSIGTKAVTPNIDSIFEQGVHFPNGYVTHATSAPSRAAVMTGQYQARFDFEVLPGNTEQRLRDDYGVDTNLKMVGQLMKEAGYDTMAYGKWHLGVDDKYQPHTRGFDHWFGYRGESGYYQFRSEQRAVRRGRPVQIVEGEKPNLDLVINGESVERRGWLTDVLTEDARQKILAERDNPFFMYYAPYNVHTPDLAPPEYIPEGGDGYDGLIQNMDVQIGILLDALEEAGIADNTLVVFSNDNGGKRDRTKTFRGGKASYYEGGVRVPFAMRWPNKIQPGTTFDGMVSTLDLLPTFVAAGGGELQEGIEYDGYDLMPFISGEKPESDFRDRHFWRTGTWRAARHEDWKLVQTMDRRKMRSLHNDLGIEHYKGRRIVQAERDDALFNAPELYNLANDPMETTNLADSHPKKLEEMVNLYNEWQDTIPRWRDNNAE